MRVTNPVKRGSALLLVAAIGALGPVTTPLPALAQESQSDAPWAPPPVDTPLPTDDGLPNETYEQSVTCVKSGSVEQQTTLKQAPWGQQYLRLDEVHDLMNSTTGSRGKGVKVAVIDTGVRTDHPFFQNRVTAAGDYVLKKDQGGLDCDGHGTEVAGIIGANVTDGAIAFQGVAPDVQLLSIRQSSENYKKSDEPASPPPEQPGDGQGQQNQGGQPGDGQGGQNQGDGGGAGQGDTGPAQDGEGRVQGSENGAGTLETLAEAIMNATKQQADVVNISINSCRVAAAGGRSDGEGALQAAVRYAADRDVLIVSAAGNTGENCPQNDQADANAPKSIVTPPWFADDVLSVAAIEQSGGVAEFSMHGPWVSVAAPGTNITSLDPAPGSSGLANQTIEGDGQPQPINGTSFAAPYVTGLAALVRAKFPELDAREVMHRIESTAQHPAAPGGRDNFVGYGVIDPMAALTAIVPEEAGLPKASSEPLASDLPPANDESPLPMIVALAGAGGALVALLVTLFVVHTIRRNRPSTESG